MTLSGISTTLLPLWKVHSPRLSLSLKYSSSPSFRDNYCWSFQPEPQEIHQWAFLTFTATGSCNVALRPTILLLHGSHHNCKSPIAFVTMLNACLPLQTVNPRKAVTAPQVSCCRKGEWPQAPAATLICIHHGVRTRPSSFPWAVSSHWPRSARNAGHSCQVWDFSNRQLQGFPVHLAKTFSETGCSLRLLLPRLLPSLSPSYAHRKALPTLFSLFSSPSLSSLFLRTRRTHTNTGSNVCFFPKAWNKVWCTTGAQLICVKWICALRQGEDQPKECGWISMDWTHSLGKQHQEYALKNWY